MSKIIMAGCDLHDQSMLIRFAVGAEDVGQACFRNDSKGRAKMIAGLKARGEKLKATRILFVYEASGLGHGLSDQLHEAGIECYVLSPTHLPKTAKQKRLKTDAKDAQMLLEQLKGFVLAGNPLPAVWTPPKRLRNDRELVRARVDVADELTRVKLKINTFLKAHEITVDSPTKCRWTRAFVRWIRDMVIPELDAYVGIRLKLLLDRFDMYLREQAELDQALTRLSSESRYRNAYSKILLTPGVGPLVAMTFLTEMGDLSRFKNRRQVGAYLGLCPSSYESGEKNDRKGRITRQGSARLRKMLCQAAWVAIRYCHDAAHQYHRIKQGQQKRTKKALVAVMRKLGIKIWRQALSCGVPDELVGRARPCPDDFSRARQRGTSPPSASSRSAQAGEG